MMHDDDHGRAMISGRTRILGIFGDPVAHSLSPVMQNAALAAAGIDAVYVPFRVGPPALPQAVAAVRALGLLGVNVTVPHKEAVCRLLDRIEGEARLIGAVNTIVHREGELIGYNTDAPGFLRSLAEDLNLQPEGKRILLLGAGGACRAALVALSRAGAKWVGIANRTPERARGLTEEFSAKLPGTPLADFPLDWRHLKPLLPGIDLVVNTSALGLKGEMVELPWEDLVPGTRVYDMVYAPGGTSLVRAAREHGLRAADGLGMLAGQGEEAFFLWTGQRPPSGVMKSRLLSAADRTER